MTLQALSEASAAWGVLFNLLEQDLSNFLNCFEYGVRRTDGLIIDFWLMRLRP